MQKNMNVGIYTRLSRDDKNYNSESASISNQRDTLIQTVNERGWRLVDEYSDDGFTGTNFDRPEFIRLKEDIESGKINCIITTDCSRLGRHASMTGYYIGTYFAEQSVRYVSLYDNIDTERGYNQMVSIYLAIHEMYPAQVSVKVRDVKKRKAKKGEFIGSQAPYGYIKSDTNKNLLLVDDFAAKIVKRIFEEYAGGKSARAIADSLNSDKVSTPSVYFVESIKKEIPKKINAWNSNTVSSILRRQAYLGNMVQGTRENVSFLVKKRRKIDIKDWIVVEDTHEPIIELALFNTVQERLLKNPKHRTRRAGKKREAILNEIAFCSDCGYPMTAAHIGKKEVFTYRCRNYVQGGKSACSSHSIKADEIENYILSDIRKHAILSQSDKQSLVQDVLNKLNKEKSNNEKMLLPKIKRLEKTIETTNFTISQLFKEKITGKLPEKIFYSLMEEYEQEQVNAEKELADTRNILNAEIKRQNNAELWISEIKKYLDVEVLTRSMVMNLVERIEISDTCKNNSTDLEVTIQYKFASDFFVKNEKIA